jgi:chorismate synthase
MVAIEMARAILEKFPHDDFNELEEAVSKYKTRVSEY